MSNEQWKEGGKCNICRRKNYCNNPCNAAKERRQYERSCAVSQAMFRTMLRIMEKE